MRFSRHNFSIVELLVVIGIAAVLMGLALPGFNHMINGDKVTASARQLSGAIAHARSEAILSGRNVALLLPMADAGTFKNSYKNRSYAVVRLERGSDGVNSTSAIDLKTLSEVHWSLFPKGAVLWGVTTSASAPASSTGTALATVTAGSSVAPLSEAGTGTSYHALVFKPDGTVLPASTLYLYLTEGIYESGSALTATNKDSSGNVQNILKLSLNPYTGRCRFED